ncbi:hypothetical protein P3X46_030912 [Hevea brasiliensis]|uniref:Cytochrome P450 n=1 Tax=Hevea brasiliensis TaxID=3981 RepID=A0ABQ9KK55_HEVBR|nr:cytochrome P450 71AP13 [Hevea brasiliensis]KAJ9140240.1 hypothetical protein P3X46_030912 [Hevea brasiliensis]
MALDQWLKDLGFKPSLVLATIFVAMVLRFLPKEKQRKKYLNLPPGPGKLPFIGNLHQLGNMPHISLHRLAHKYGPIIFLQLGQIPTVVISSSNLAKQVLKAHDLALCSRPQLYSAKYLFYDCTDIAFAPYGAYWRNIRKICILELLSAKRVQSFGYIRKEEVARLVARIGESYPDTTNLSKMIGLYANDVLCRVALGRDFSRGGEYDRHGFQKMLDDYQALLGGFSLGDYFPSMEFVHSLTGMKSKLINTYRRFDQFFDGVINEHRNNSEGKLEEQKDLVDVLLDIQKNGSSDSDTPLTMDNVKAVILDMFAAGTDTTFITLDWTMTELIMNPRVMEKAQAEIRSIVGERKVVQESDLLQFHYMKAVIKEIFRLHPPVPVLVPRESLEDVVIDGYDIPAKTRIYVNVWAMGRDPEQWENPETFQPERFMGSSIDFKGQGFELIPFGAGRRSCPAITFATATVELALAQLLHSFDWELPPGIKAGDIDNTEAFGISMHRIVPLHVIAKTRFQ